MGHSIKSASLDPYRPWVKAQLLQYTNDPAIVAAHGIMNDFLQYFGSDKDHASVGRKCRPMLDHILAAGATPRSAMIELAALTWYWQTEELKPLAAEMDTAYAVRLLLHKRLSGGKGTNRNTWPRTVIAALGYNLRIKLGPTWLQMHAVWKRGEETDAARLKLARSFAPTS